MFKKSFASAHLFPILWPFQQIAWTTGIYLTMLLALERYLSVLHGRMPPMRKTVVSIVSVILFGAVYNVTRFLEYTTNDITNTELNLHSLNVVENKEYGLLSKEAYIFGYLIGSNIIFRLILPLCILTFCNIKLIKKVPARSLFLLLDTNLQACCI